MWFPFVTGGDLTGALSSAFDDVDAAIRLASYRVRDELRTARFAVGPDGHPSETAVEQAVKDATLAQLTFWADTGDVSGAATQIGGGSILSVSLPGGSGTTDLSQKQSARVAPAVADILRNCDGIEWAVTYW